MSQCGKCDARLANMQEVAVCIECNTPFHPQCTRIKTVENFKKFSSSRKSGWKCDNCSVETSSTTSRTSDRDSAILQGIESLKQEMCSQFKLVNECVTGIKTEIKAVNDRIDDIKTSLNFLSNENLSRKQECAKLVEENVNLKREMQELRDQMRDIQQYSRKDNLVIIGVPYTQREDIYAVLEKIASVIKVTFLKSEISVAHRLPVNKMSSCPPILVKFLSRVAKSAWMSAARQLGSLSTVDLHSSWEARRIYFNDHLTRENQMLLGMVRRLVKEKKIAFGWSKDCKVLVRVEADGPVRRIKTEDDIADALNERKKN